MRIQKPYNEGWWVKPHEPKDIIQFDTLVATPASLPHNAVDLPYHYFDETQTHQVFSYYKTLEIDDTQLDKVIRLRFEGVAHQASVYLNGELIKTHSGGYTPFEVDIESFIKPSAPNHLVVVVDGREHPDVPPFGGVVDYLGYVGIYREVSLTYLDPIHIQDVFVQTTKSSCSAEIVTSKPTEITYTILNPKQAVVAQGHLGMNVHHHLDMTLESVMLWDLEHPNLYSLVIETAHDRLSTRFGFRTIEFKPDGFYLNQEKIALIGLNRHQSYPYVGYAMPKRMQEMDADLLKYDLGVQIARSSHYPASKHFLNRCDEIGLLVFEELPGWQHIGGEAFIQNALTSLEEMIKRDRNHPSIILWGVRINESPDHHDFYTKSNALAKKLDPSRPTGGVRNFTNSEFLEDVYTYNDFSHTGQNPGVTPKHKITKAKPYLVTEHNGHMFPTKKFDPESKRIEQALRHLNVINDALDPKAGIAGAIGWCMNDYNTHKEFGSGDKICYHGVLDMDRLPKIAAYAYQSQQSKQPMMHISSQMQNGEYAGGYLEKVVVFTNLDYIKLYRNETYIDTYYPNKKTYPNLPHPPIIITDFIGQTLKEKEHMSFKDAEKTKRILRKIQKEGNHLPLWDQIGMLLLLKKYKLKLSDGVRMFFEYTSGWGSNETTFTFEGYQNEQLVLKQTIESVKTPTYRLSGPDTLEIDDTYDVIKLVVEKTNTAGHVLDFAMDGFTIKVEGDIALIGPHISHLQGGSRAIYIQSKGIGSGTIQIEFEDIVLTKTVQVTQKVKPSV